MVKADKDTLGEEDQIINEDRKKSLMQVQQSRALLRNLVAETGGMGGSVFLAIIDE